MIPNRIRPLATGFACFFALLLTLSYAQAGNKELMEEWSRKKQQVKDQVFEQLKKEGKIPQDGTVYFEARTKADPEDNSKVLIEVDSVRVETASLETPGTQADGKFPGGAGTVDSDASNLPYAKGKPGSSKPGVKEDTLAVPSAGKVPASSQALPTLIRYETLNIPVGTVFQEKMHIKNGAIQAEPQAQSKTP